MRLLPRGWSGYVEAVTVVAAATVAALAMFPHVEVSNLIMAYLLGVILVARRQARGPSLLASVLSVAAFDFFFIPPYYHFAVASAHYLLTFAIMLIVALVISGLTVRLRAQVETAHKLADEARSAEVRAETERLRSSLLSSVSHDLRTPLATITGAVSTVLESGERLDPTTRRELLESARDEAERLNRLVHNLLQMTRLESGTFRLHTDWHPMEEVIGAALGRCASRLGDRPITTRIPADLPLVAIDDVLIEQVLMNLLDNALKYSPAGTPLAIAVGTTNGVVNVEVADQGPGVPPGEERRVFEKFYRGEAGRGRGAGLGLAICQGIVRAHGGAIHAENLPSGGLAVRFTLPLGEAPPVVAGDN
jgi:two-component system sensor histidine kinase KdpD